MSRLKDGHTVCKAQTQIHGGDARRRLRFLQPFLTNFFQIPYIWGGHIDEVWVVAYNGTRLEE